MKGFYMVEKEGGEELDGSGIGPSGNYDFTLEAVCEPGD